MFNQTNGEWVFFLPTAWAQAILIGVACLFILLVVLLAVNALLKVALEWSLEYSIRELPLVKNDYLGALEELRVMSAENKALAKRLKR